MECKKVQELLKSDYFDSEINSGEGRLVKEHLAGCPTCRGLEKELQSQRLIFQKAAQQQVPERVWHNIQNAIDRQELSQDVKVGPNILERLYGFLFGPRPVFALASTLAGLVIIMIFSVAIIQRSLYLENKISAEFVSTYSISTDSEDVITDLGTNIEQYFL